MPRVRIMPADVELEVNPGESVAEAAWRQGWVWPTQCWGQADCLSCFTRIVDGEQDAVPAEDLELDAIRLKMTGKMRTDGQVRLACQLRCTGTALVLEKRGFRREIPEDNNMLTAEAEPSRA
ncbi:hypothetical protein GCM10017594_20530 [Microbacterium terrae]|nr:hypothetical protein GCM10017594_20530 [Microbacterium terrae]